MVMQYYRCTTGVLQVYYRCTTGVIQVYYRCNTGVLQVYYRCTTGVLQVYYRCTTGVYHRKGVDCTYHFQLTLLNLCSPRVGVIIHYIIYIIHIHYTLYNILYIIYAETNIKTRYSHEQGVTFSAIWIDFELSKVQIQFSKLQVNSSYIDTVKLTQDVCKVSPVYSIYTTHPHQNHTTHPHVQVLQ
ncbi:hypothetical protein NQD34_010003 [Periophthalmus magnuspinnatus]|nr:hypothetical protein NQD34_010003 [Periophthalmus magnuspinnatus]